MGTENPNKPSRPLRLSAPNRHIAAKVGKHSIPKATTTVALSSVDVEADIVAINRGDAIRKGNDFTANGRIYRMKGQDSVFPLSGPGLYQLDRGAFRALMVYNELGLTARAELELDRWGVIVEARELARAVYRADRSL